MHMPDGSGLEITQEVRKASKTIWIVAMTSHRLGAEDDLLDAAVRFGVDHAEEKPLRLKELCTTIERFFSIPT